MTDRPLARTVEQRRPGAAPIGLRASRLVGGALLTIGGPAGAQDGLPIAEWLGVERIVVACDAGAGDELCAAVLAQARRQTAYPVVLRADVQPRPRHDLMLSVRATGGDAARAVELRLSRSVLTEERDAAPPQRFTTPSGELDEPLRAALQALFAPPARSRPGRLSPGRPPMPRPQR